MRATRLDARDPAGCARPGWMRAAQMDKRSTMSRPASLAAGKGPAGSAKADEKQRVEADAQLPGQPELAALTGRDLPR